jgi:hypothetical protein
MSTFRDEALKDLRRRIAATNWPEKETVADQSQGVPLAMIQNLAPHWMTGYDWRACEAKLNAVPQFMTEIDGLDIHFIHARSQHEDALPLAVNHGWPASIIEQLKIIHRLTNPTAHSASAADALVLRQCRGIGTANAVLVVFASVRRVLQGLAQPGYDRGTVAGPDIAASTSARHSNRRRRSKSRSTS